MYFGFFGFFFEGKLSHTLEDELFQENRRKAQLSAYKIGFKLLFVVIWLMGMGIMRLEKAQYNPSLKLAIEISRAVKAPIEDIFVYKL